MGEDEESLWEDVKGFLGNLWNKYKTASAIVLPIAIIGTSYATPTPENPHAHLIDRIKARYVNIGHEGAKFDKELVPVHVWTGRESLTGEPNDTVTYPETLWVWQWIDAVNVDVACCMNIIDRKDHYDVFFMRGDAGEDGLNLEVEIDGIKYADFLKEGMVGFRGITMIK